MDELQTPAPPKVSALIVSRNNAPALRRTLAALEASKGRETMEILLMDQGSTDASPRLDQDFPELTILRLVKNFGFARAANIGMRTAKGEYVLFLDPYAEVLPDTAAKLAAVLDQRADASAACAVLLDPDGKPIPFIRALPSPGNENPEPVAPKSAGEIQNVDFPGLAALMVRLHAIRGINYISESYGESWVDAEICYQIRKVNKKILLVPDAQVTVYPEPLQPEDPALPADRLHGAATFLGQHFGFATGFTYRLKAIFKALIGFRLGVVSSLIAGDKIDGNQ